MVLSRVFWIEASPRTVCKQPKVELNLKSKQQGMKFKRHSQNLWDSLLCYMKALDMAGDGPLLSELKI